MSLVEEKVSEPIDLFFSCRGLKASTGDPDRGFDSHLKVTVKSGAFDKYLGVTEVVPRDSNPNYKKGIRMDYLPNEKQSLVITCYEKEDDPAFPAVGEAVADLAYILKFPGGAEVPIWNGERNTGTIIIRMNKVEDARKSILFKVSCRDIKNVETFSKSDPFIILSRPVESHLHFIKPEEVPENLWLKLYETEHVNNNLNPNYAPFEVTWWDLCRGYTNALLRWQIWDEETVGSPRLISTAYTSLEKIMQGHFTIETKDKEGKNAGTIEISQTSETQSWNFNEMESQGVNYRPVVFVDCSASCSWFHAQRDPNVKLENGIDGYSQEKSILEKLLGDLVQSFANHFRTNRFALYGFGAKFKNSKVPMFAFNLNESNAAVTGYEEACKYYRSVLPLITMDEPAKFDPVIEKTQLMSAHQTKYMPNIYTHAIIITDGDVGDRDKLVDNIVECSSMPISICFIGMSKPGDDSTAESFAYLNYLDTGVNIYEPKTRRNGDKKEKLKNNNEVEAERDCTTFIKYESFKDAKEFGAAIYKNFGMEISSYFKKYTPKPVPVREALKEPSTPMYTPINGVRVPIGQVPQPGTTPIKPSEQKTADPTPTPTPVAPEQPKVPAPQPSNPTPPVN